MIMVMNLQGEVRMDVHIGKESACTRMKNLVCDVRMVALTIVLCVQYACVQLFCIIFAVTSCVAQPNLGLSTLLQVILCILMFRLESTQCILD
jgi:hypothetical protein